MALASRSAAATGATMGGAATAAVSIARSTWAADRGRAEAGGAGATRSTSGTRPAAEAGSGPRIAQGSSPLATRICANKPQNRGRTADRATRNQASSQLGELSRRWLQQRVRRSQRECASPYQQRVGITPGKQLVARSREQQLRLGLGEPRVPGAPAQLGWQSRRRRARRRRAPALISSGPRPTRPAVLSRHRSVVHPPRNACSTRPVARQSDGCAGPSR